MMRKLPPLAVSPKSQKRSCSTSLVNTSISDDTPKLITSLNNFLEIPRSTSSLNYSNSSESPFPLLLPTNSYLSLADLDSETINPVRVHKTSDLQSCFPVLKTENLSNFEAKTKNDFCGLNSSWNSKSNRREVSTERSEVRETFIEKSFDGYISELTLMKKELNSLNDRLSENQKNIADQRSENLKMISLLKSFKKVQKQKSKGLCECGII